MSNTIIKETCPTCDGDGFDRYIKFIDYMIPCPDCDGSGFLKEESE